jgi:hypothetical protein
MTKITISEVNFALSYLAGLGQVEQSRDITKSYVSVNESSNELIREYLEEAATVLRIPVGPNGLTRGALNGFHDAGKLREFKEPDST